MTFEGRPRATCERTSKSFAAPRGERLRTPLAHFIGIGVLSTIAYAMLYLILRAPLGANGANALALALTAVANTQANRRFTFGVRGRAGLLRQHAAGAV
ncbi:MAG: GtrA family protein, partial [Solirubrobacterales bacterium]|nr:GtrA family protein [Solirubrobacterales bacterium]